MTVSGLVFDCCVLGLIAILAVRGKLRGGARAFLELAALIVALFLTPWVGGGIARLIGGGFYTVFTVALVLLVLALLISGWAWRRLARARGNLEKPEIESARASGVIGSLVGAGIGVVLAASMALLSLYLSIQAPVLEPLCRGSFCIRLVDQNESTLRAWIQGREAPRQVPGATTRASEGDEGAASTGIAELSDLEAMRAVLDDDELMRAIEHGNYGVLLGHPRLVELWQEPRFRDFLSRVDRHQLMMESERMNRLAADYEAMLEAHLEGDQETALAAADRVIELDQDYGHILVMRGLILETAGDLDAARAALQEARERYEDSAEAPTRLADLAASAGDHDLAEALYAEALEREPDYPYAIYSRGILRYETHRYLEGIADLRRALELRPDDERLVLGYADALARLTDESITLVTAMRRDANAWQRILDWHERFVAACPDAVQPHFSLSLVRYIGVTEQGREDGLVDALEELQRAELLAEVESPALAEQLRSLRGSLLLRQGDVQAARAIHEPLLEAGRLPLEYAVDVFTELAIHHARQGELEEARRFIGVTVCALSGTGLQPDLFLRKYRGFDPEGEPLDCDELEEFVPGQILVYRGSRGEVTYSEESAERTLVVDDRLLTIEGVKPLWPGEVRELIIAAMRDPPVRLQVDRGGVEVEIDISSGLEHLDWDVTRPFLLP